jgi:hypothetical protein
VNDIIVQIFDQFFKLFSFFNQIEITGELRFDIFSDVDEIAELNVHSSELTLSNLVVFTTLSKDSSTFSYPNSSQGNVSPYSTFS